MCWSTSTVNFFTGPGGTAGSVGSTFWNFSNAMPLASAIVGAGGSAVAAFAAVVLTTVVVAPGPSLPPVTIQAITATRAMRPAKKPMMPAVWKNPFGISAEPSAIGGSGGLGGGNSGS